MMICEEEIYEWFKHSASSQRIDVVCSLLRLCLPLELRFVGSCLEDLARKDYHSLREYEIKSNDNSGYTTLMSSSTAEELQNTLNIYVSLLHSTNTVCANSLFHILERLLGTLQSTLLLGLSGGNTRSVGGENAAEDLLLLFTMAAHHPAFTFSQRIKICESLTNLKQVLSSLGLIKLFRKERETTAKNVNENSLHLDASNTPRTSDSDRQSYSTPDPALQFYMTVLETRRNNRSRYLEFNLETNWPDGAKVQMWRSYKDLQIFHQELEKHFGGVLDDENIPCYLPQIPAREKNSQNDKQMSDALKAYFREIFLLPSNITEEDRFRCLLRELIRKSDVPASISPMPSLSIGKAQNSLSAPSSPHSASPNTLSPSNKAVVSKLPNDSLVNLVVTITTSQLTSISLQSCRSNHLLGSSKSGVSSAHSSPSSSSQSSAFLLSQNARSRHNSSQGQSSIGAWLKEIRLHKYEAQLSKYSWDELFSLTDADLQREGFTSGACKKFANEIHGLKSRIGNNLESFLYDSSTSSRSSNLTNPSASKQCSVPASALVSKSVPGMSSPGSIDSSCSDDFPPGSPEPRQSSVNKSRNRTILGQQTSMTSPLVKEKDKSDTSKSAIVSRPSDLMADSDVSVVRSISLESSLVQRHSAEPIGIRPFYAPSGEESSDSGIIQSPSEKFARATVTPVLESISMSQALPGVVELTHSVVDPVRVPGMTAVNPWQVTTQGQQVWSALRAVNVPQLVPHVVSTETQVFCSGSRPEGMNLAQTHPEGMMEEIASHSSGFSPRLPGHPVLDLPHIQPSLPIPSDAVLVRPRGPVGVPPIARIPAIVSPVTRFSDVDASNLGPVADTVSKNCSHLSTDMSSNPHFLLQGPASTVLYPPAPPVSPAFHPPVALHQMNAGTQNKTGYLTPRGTDTSDSSPGVHTPTAFSVDLSVSAESRPVEAVNHPSGMTTFLPGFFGFQPPLPAPDGSLPMRHSGMPYSITVTTAVMSPVSHSVSQNVISFPANDDQMGDDICHACGQFRPRISYPNMWPVEPVYPRSACFPVIAPHHGSPQFRPLRSAQVPFQFQNGINPELHYQASCAYSLTGARPMLATRPGCAAPFPQYIFRCHAGAGTMASLSSCSNCGSSGHSHLECKEQTIESVVGTGLYRLNIVPKTETG